MRKFLARNGSSKAIRLSSHILWTARLPFGGKHFPEVFNRLTQAVKRIMTKNGYTCNAVIVYLDDFLVTGETKKAYQAAFDVLCSLLQPWV